MRRVAIPRWKLNVSVALFTFHLDLGGGGNAALPKHPRGGGAASPSEITTCTTSRHRGVHTGGHASSSPASTDSLPAHSTHRGDSGTCARTCLQMRPNHLSLYCSSVRALNKCARSAHMLHPCYFRRSNPWPRREQPRLTGCSRHVACQHANHL